MSIKSKVMDITLLLMAVTAYDGCDESLTLQQLLGNLLDNALTHGEEGRPVSIVAEANESRLVVRVANEGVELDPETIAHVFEPFWRPRRSKGAEGLGLGLFICAHIASRHGGSIRIESANGATTFVFSMPVARS